MHLLKTTRTKWKTQNDLIESASKFHNKVRDIFRQDSYFQNLRCYQEVNVRDLYPNYEYTNHHYDWYIDELRIVIELHGEQHYKMVNFGNIGYDQAKRNFIQIKHRDIAKKYAAINAGLDYTAIPYKEYKNLDASRLKQLIFYGE